MRKIEKRSVFCLILAALLGIGLAFFCFRFVADGDDWASYPYNRHLYNNQGVLKGSSISIFPLRQAEYTDGIFSCGRVFDRFFL